MLKKNKSVGASLFKLVPSPSERGWGEALVGKSKKIKLNNKIILFIKIKNFTGFLFKLVPSPSERGWGEVSILFFLLIFCSNVFAQNSSPRITQSFDSSWKFSKGDTNGAEQMSFDDAAWRSLNVPHDWSIEGPYDRNNTTGRGGGYLPNGIGWYRKTFLLN
ncbi:MAG: hypothetical protein M3139_06900, partial [Bacteroidota bacterium]|nr:hypothetical protein [Bacteroidota bacterium]